MDRNSLIFRTRQVWFADQLKTFEGFDSVIFAYCKFDIQNPTTDWNKSSTLTSIINLDNDLDNIWKNFDRKSCKYSINKAEKDGVVISINEDFDEFYEIYRSFMKFKMPKFKIEKLDTLKKYGTLFTAEYENKVVCGNIYLKNDNIMLYWVNSNLRHKGDKDLNKIIGNSNRLIHWEAIKHAKKSKIHEFDFGGLFAKNNTKNYPGYTIDKFKESFGGKREVRYNYHKDYSNIYKLARRFYQILK